MNFSRGQGPGRSLERTQLVSFYPNPEKMFTRTLNPTGQSLCPQYYSRVKWMERVILRHMELISTFTISCARIQTTLLHYCCNDKNALSLICSSDGVNRWIVSMINDRHITVELQGKKKLIANRKSSPRKVFSFHS